jgi:Family of unknown function (DUF6220)
MATHDLAQASAGSAPAGRTRSEGKGTIQQTIARIYTGLAWVIVAGLLLQFYLAGAALFGATSFEAHRSLGMGLALPVAALVVLALAGHMGWRVVGFSVLLLALTVVQILLPQLRETASWVAALHPINAMILMGVTSSCARRSRMWAKEQGSVGEPVEVLSR